MALSALFICGKVDGDTDPKDEDEDEDDDFMVSKPSCCPPSKSPVKFVESREVMPIEVPFVGVGREADELMLLLPSSTANKLLFVLSTQ